MIPGEYGFAILGLAGLLVAVPYWEAERFFQSNGARLRELETVPWILRARLNRPSYSNTAAGFLIITKLVTVLAIAPTMVGIGAAIAPEQVEPMDMFLAGISAASFVGFLALDPIVMRQLRQRYGVPVNWKELLR